MDASAQPHEWALRPAVQGDLEKLAELRAVVMRPDLERLGRFDEHRVRQRLRDSFDPGHTWVIEADGASVGCIALRPDESEAWLEHFYLAPHVQNVGLGSAVLHSLLERTDADRMTVRVDVLHGSAARRLYERHGFIVESQDPIDVWMVRRPGHTAAVDDLVARLRAAGCVYAEEEAAILLEAGGDVESLVARRVAGEPLEYVVGWAEFWGLRVGVAEGVFVPRRRTEFLVERAVALAPAAERVVDLCCGSGALGLAFAAQVEVDELHLADVEPRAVACARENAAGWSRLTGLVPRPARPPEEGEATRPPEEGEAARPPEGGEAARPTGLVPRPARPPEEGEATRPPDRRSSSPSASEDGQSRPTIDVHQGDLFEALPDELRGRVDVLLANTPYVPTDAIALLPPEARDHEPKVTLDGGHDGLAVARRVAAGAGDWLAPGGIVLVETSRAQAHGLAQAFESAGLASTVDHDDELGATVVVGRRGDGRAIVTGATSS